MNVSAPNVSLNCNQYNISGDGSNGYGINLTSINSTITNCNISKFQYEVYLLSNFSNVSNNYLNGDVVIYVGSSAKNNSISNNNISGRTKWYGVNNTFKFNNLSTTSQYAFDVENSSNYFISNNINSTSQYEIALASGANNNTFISNNISSTNNYAVYLVSSSWNNFISNNITSKLASYGIYLTASSQNNFTNNYMIDWQAELLGLFTNSNNNTFYNNTIIGNNSVYIHAPTSSTNNTFLYNNMTANDNLWIESAGTANYFNSSSVGNYYYWNNGSGAWNLSQGGHNWSCYANSPPCFADYGSGLPVQSSDYHPYTENSAFNSTGLSLCNQTLSTAQSIIYKFYDASTLANINATTSSLITYSNGSSTTITSTNATAYICIAPPVLSVNATIGETFSSTGYQTLTNARPSTNYSNNTITYNVYLTNSSLGAYYTLLIENAYGAPIQGATVVAYHFQTSNSTWLYMQTITSDSTGSAVFFLVPANLYNFTVSASGYTSFTFSLTPATQYVIPVMFAQSVSNLPQNWSIINDTYVSISPAGGYYNSSQTLTYTIQNNNSNLSSWGMNIYKNNGTNTSLVYSGSSVVATGGTLTYVATANATYYLNAWFLHLNYTNFTIQPFSYYITSQRVGLPYISQLLQNTNAINGWTFYAIALLISLLIGIALYQFGSGASAIGALISLWVFTMVAPATMVVFTSPFGFAVSPFIASFILTIGTLAGLYLTSYGV